MIYNDGTHLDNVVQNHLICNRWRDPWLNRQTGEDGIRFRNRMSSDDTA